MKKFFLASAAVIGLTGVAYSADLPAKPVYKAPIAAPIFTWNGFYVGANVGIAWGLFDNRLSIVNGPLGDGFFNTAIGQDRDVAAAGASRIRASGFTGGAQVGYNFQINRAVLGFEVDFGALDLSGPSSGTFLYSGLVNHPFSLTTAVRTNWLLTARPRVGYVFDRTLVYATGGIAVTNLNFDQNFQDLPPLCNPVPACSETASRRSTRVGYALGAGLEYALRDNWTAKGEYLYLNFGSTNVSGLLGTPVVGSGTATFNNSVQLDAHVFRFGANYRLGTGPIIAR